MTISPLSVLSLRHWLILVVLIGGVCVALAALPILSTQAQGTLPPPTRIICEGYARDELVLLWNDNANDETGYIIERSPTSRNEDFSEIARVVPREDGIYDRFSERINPDERFYYRLRAFRASNDAVSQPSEMCIAPRIYETEHFRYFYRLRDQAVPCPLVDNQQPCLNDLYLPRTLERSAAAMEGARLSFARMGFDEDAGVHRAGLDKVPVIISWCDGGGCAVGSLHYMALAPRYLEYWFDKERREGDPANEILSIHELFHLQQYWYPSPNDPDKGWMLEGQARMSQDKTCLGSDPTTCRHFDDIEGGYAGYVGQVRDYLSNPGQNLLTSSYSAALFWTYLTEQYGTSPTNDVEYGMNFVAEFRKNARDNPNRDGIAVINETLADLGHADDFEDAFRDFVVANYAKDLDEDVPSRYRYRDVDQGTGGNYGPPLVTIRDVGRFTGPDVSGVTIGPWAARYYVFNIEDNEPFINIRTTQQGADDKKPRFRPGGAHCEHLQSSGDLRLCGHGIHT